MNKYGMILGYVSLEALEAAIFTAVLSLIVAAVMALQFPLVWENMGFSQYELGLDLLWAWMSSFPAIYLIVGVAIIAFLRKKPYPRHELSLR